MIDPIMTIGLGHYLTLSGMLFVVGALGVALNRRHVIVLLMSIELMLLAVNINMVAFSHFGGNITGQILLCLFLPLLQLNLRLVWRSWCLLTVIVARSLLMMPQR